MAKKAKADERGEVDDETGKTVLPNTEARNVCIQDGFKKLYNLRRQKEALEAEHLKDVKDEIKLVRRTLKADTDIDSEDLDLAFKLYEREQLAKAMEDDDADRIQDNIKVIFGALKKGDMVDFIAVLQEAA